MTTRKKYLPLKFGLESIKLFSISSFTLVLVQKSESLGSIPLGKNEMICKGPEYISNLSVVKDGVTVFRYEGLIGIAENTYFKLPFVKDKSIEVYAEDNLGNQFEFNSLGF